MLLPAYIAAGSLLASLETMSASAYLENPWSILRIHLGKQDGETNEEQRPYWSFHLKESHGLDEPIGLFKCGLPVFKGR